jgi:hypothetical protein
MKLEQLFENILDKPTPSLEEIADKHDFSVDELKKQLKKGIKVELEHTSDKKVAEEIAKDHLNEDPEYYEKLEEVEKE